jgi:putative endonuclease
MSITLNEKNRVIPSLQSGRGIWMSLDWETTRFLAPQSGARNDRCLKNGGITMKSSKQYYIYILASVSRKLYLGITNNLWRRVWEHKQGIVHGFAQQFHIKKLVYYEMTGDVRSAIHREKQLKKWRREKKVALIEKMNPTWRDLYDKL